MNPLWFPSGVTSGILDASRSEPETVEPSKQRDEWITGFGASVAASPDAYSMRHHTKHHHTKHIHQVPASHSWGS